MDFDPYLILQNLSKLFIYDEKNPMLFNSGAFLVLFTAFITVYAFIFNHKRARIAYILAFSLFFYYKSGGAYLIILLFSIVLDYWVALGMESLLEQKKKTSAKALLVVSICANVGLLMYFKYTNLLVESALALYPDLATIFDITIPPGFDPAQKDLFDIVLPIGISFYTFQTLSYVIDVYKGLIPARKNLLDYAFYMSFFPHLVAGPIVRAKDFLPQIDVPIHISKSMVGRGFYFILKGLVKKAIIADYVARYSDLVFTSPDTYSGFESLMGMYAYTLQIYCDFSGYSDMAIGLALIMGYRLGDNFNLPYLSTNITEFWRRWHISLSSWLRDYIYIPLGGNRKGQIRTYLHLFATMLIGGFWHGASWKFVLWGAMHGIGLAIHKLFSGVFGGYFPKKGLGKYVFGFLGWLITFHFVAFLWIFFRATSFDSAWVTINKIFCETDPAYILPFYEARTYFVWMLLFGYATHFIPEKLKAKFSSIFTELPSWSKALLLLIIIQVILKLKDENVQPFIYFQF